MAEKYLPIQFFKYREVDDRRTEAGGNNEEPKWVFTDQQLKKKSEQLLSELDAFSLIIAEREKKEAIVPFVFKAILQEKATAKSRRRYVEKVFETSRTRSNLIGVLEKEELLVRINGLQEFQSITQHIAEYKNFNYGISCIDRIEAFTPLVTKDNAMGNYKVKILDFQNYEDNLAITRFLERILIKNKIFYKKTEYAKSYNIYNVFEEQKAILDVLENNDIFESVLSIEPMPKYAVMLDTCILQEEIPIIKPEDGKEYATLGVLDNGISEIPHLKPWLVGERLTSYPEDKITPNHGTATASIALYGDILENSKWVGHNGIKIFDATVYPDTSKETIDEDELVQNIKEAIENNYENIKVWNLSISLKGTIEDSNFSDFAKFLDFMQERYSILVCKSAGNCYNFVKGFPKGRLNRGADSVLSLVIGSIEHEKGIHDIADINNPSPFSRIGPGPEFIIKPELVHYGGNAGVNDDGEMVTTGVKTFAMNGETVKASGTSFSTPRIAALATGLSQEIRQDFDSLIIKGMIVHSANYPNGLNIPYEERTKYVGYGKPTSIQEMLYNSPHEITLILRETLVRGKYLEILDFPMPSCLIKDGFFTGQIIATLVYSPILEPSQGSEYCQSNINLLFGTYDDKMSRDITQKHILNPVGKKAPQNIFKKDLYSKIKVQNSTGEFARRERLLIEFAEKYYPVKKYAVDLTDLTDGNKRYITENKNWYLKLEGLYRSFTEHKTTQTGMPQQDFCLLITIKDPSETLNVYNETVQKLDAFQFWHNNINLASQITVRN
jgi:hypothetical protein